MELELLFVSRLDFFEGRSETLPLSDLRLPALPLFTKWPECWERGRDNGGASRVDDDGGGTDNADVGIKDDAGGGGNDGGVDNNGGGTVDDNGGGTDANCGPKDEDTGPVDGKVDTIGPGVKDNPANGGVKEGENDCDDVKACIDD